MDLKTLADIPPWDWPEDTAEILLGVLRDDRGSGSNRILAAELAGSFTVMSDELAEALLALLRDGDLTDELRGRAAVALGPALECAGMNGFDDPEEVPISEGVFHRAQKSLQSLYRDAETPKDVRRRILEASVRVPQEWHTGAIRVAFSTGDPAWRLTAVFCMSYVQGFDEEILEALNSEDARQ